MDGFSQRWMKMSIYFSQSFVKLIITAVLIFVATKQLLIFAYLFSSFRCFHCLKLMISTEVSVIKIQTLLTSSASRCCIATLYFLSHMILEVLWIFPFLIFQLLIILCYKKDLFLWFFRTFIRQNVHKLNLNY